MKPFNEQDTVAFNESLSDEEKYERVKAAKIAMGTTWSDEWDKNYTPYCFAQVNGKDACRSPRMKHRSYGFQCPECGNMLGFNMKRLKESPLNRIERFEPVIVDYPPEPLGGFKTLTTDQRLKYQEIYEQLKQTAKDNNIALIACDTTQTGIGKATSIGAHLNTTFAQESKKEDLEERWNELEKKEDASISVTPNPLEFRDQGMLGGGFMLAAAMSMMGGSSRDSKPFNPYDYDVVQEVPKSFKQLPTLSKKQKAKRKNTRS